MHAKCHTRRSSWCAHLSTSLQSCEKALHASKAYTIVPACVITIKFDSFFLRFFPPNIDNFSMIQLSMKCLHGAIHNLPNEVMNSPNWIVQLLKVHLKDGFVSPHSQKPAGIMKVDFHPPIVVWIQWLLRLLAIQSLQFKEKKIRSQIRWNNVKPYLSCYT